MSRKLKVLVLGGNGFIGSQIVAKLANQAEVIIGTRQLTMQKNMRTIRMQSMLSIHDWKQIVSNFDMVVNCVGILRERKSESYEAIHHLAVAALAQACAWHEISLIHLSALGLSEHADSGFIRSKLAGERAVLASSAMATIVRPSLLDGDGGFGAKWFRRVAAWPVQFVMKSEGLVAPLQVSDLGEAIANLIFLPQALRPTIVELGGSETLSIPDYLTLLRKVRQQSSAVQIAAPKLMVRLVSHIFDLLAWTPLSFGHYELMQGHNVPSVNALPKLLGRKPSNLGQNDEELANKGALLTQEASW
ncbi:MAG: sugar nucleotide-binding protein [Methylophilaceae bacterium]